MKYNKECKSQKYAFELFDQKLGFATHSTDSVPTEPELELFLDDGKGGDDTDTISVK